jgi:hypothetical protein
MWQTLLVMLLITTSAFANQDAEQEIAVPISKLFSLTLRDVWVPRQWNSQNQVNVVEFRPLVPFELGDRLNIMRITLPYRTTTANGPGLGDVRVFDLLTFGTRRGFWGIGPVFNLRANTLPVTDTIQGGFVLGLIAYIKPWSFGLLNQNLFSDRIAASTLQPVLIYQLSERWTIGLGELPFVFDWKSLSRTFVPLGFQVGFQAGPIRQPFRFFVNPQYNTRNVARAPQWTVTTGMTLPIAFPTDRSKRVPE